VRGVKGIERIFILTKHIGSCIIFMSFVFPSSLLGWKKIKIKIKIKILSFYIVDGVSGHLDGESGHV
jgi:hypothetical protein